MRLENPAPYWLKLRTAASGGFVVGLFLIAWANLPLESAREASLALKAFQSGVASPEPLILVPVLVLLLACMALSGSGPVDLISRFMLRPALRYCGDFCVTAAGAVLPFGFLGLQIDWLKSIGIALTAFLVAACAGYVFHSAAWLSEQMSSDAVSSAKRKAINWVGILCLGAFVLLIARRS